MKLTKLQSFIYKSNIVHAGQYDYSLVSYSNSTTPVDIICKIHGNFTQKPNIHVFGSGCPACGRLRTLTAARVNNESKRSTTAKFIEKATLIHGNEYDYSDVDYINCKTKVIIKCATHGVFLQQPNKHLDKIHPTGCPTCANKNKTTVDFVNKSTLVHNTLYDYSKSVYRGDAQNITIICNIHGEFRQMPCNHYAGSGCPTCALLSYNNIGYYQQSLFDQFPSKKQIPATLYYIKLYSSNETFYKIGITIQNNIAARFYGFPYTVDIITTITGNLYDMWIKEQSLLQSVERYQPIYKFSGWTECFNLPLVADLSSLV